MLCSRNVFAVRHLFVCILWCVFVRQMKMWRRSLKFFTTISLSGRGLCQASYSSPLVSSNSLFLSVFLPLYFYSFPLHVIPISISFGFVFIVLLWFCCFRIFHEAAVGQNFIGRHALLLIHEVDTHLSSLEGWKAELTCAVRVCSLCPKVCIHRSDLCEKRGNCL